MYEVSFFVVRIVEGVEEERCGGVFEVVYVLRDSIYQNFFGVFGRDIVVIDGDDVFFFRYEVIEVFVGIV